MTNAITQFTQQDLTLAQQRVTTAKKWNMAFLIIAGILSVVGCFPIIFPGIIVCLLVIAGAVTSLILQNKDSKVAPAISVGVFVVFIIGYIIDTIVISAFVHVVTEAEKGFDGPKVISMVFLILMIVYIVFVVVGIVGLIFAVRYLKAANHFERVSSAVNKDGTSSNATVVDVTTQPVVSQA